MGEKMEEEETEEGVEGVGDFCCFCSFGRGVVSEAKTSKSSVNDHRNKV